jgi:hypothetical protein
MTKRTYNDEQYLRADHFMENYRYLAKTAEISDVVWGCKVKKGDKDAVTIGLAFKGSDKVLGLNRTNESMVMHVTGHSNPEKWIGHKIQLVVRLVRNKKLEEPAIRVWSAVPHPRGQVRDQMGKEITEAWYAANGGKVEKAAEGASGQ